jgi:hypothetical protein
MQWRLCCWLLTLPLASFAADSLYGKRYCEIVSSENFSDFNIYNTNGLNDCPKSWWTNLKDHALQKKYHFKFVYLSGPRLWLIDSIQNQPNSRDLKNIEGQKLRKVATFHPQLSSLMSRHGPYTDYQIQRGQSYHFKKGRMVYELVNPQGKIYVLHSISLKHRTQVPGQLNHLAQSLKLPSGWQIKQGQINEDKVLRPIAQTIHVIQDDFENTYQLSNQDFLK